jgi:hypothetical protein
MIESIETLKDIRTLVRALEPVAASILTLDEQHRP